MPLRAVAWPPGLMRRKRVAFEAVTVFFASITRSWAPRSLASTRGPKVMGSDAARSLPQTTMQRLLHQSRGAFMSSCEAGTPNISATAPAPARGGGRKADGPLGVAKPSANPSAPNRWPNGAVSRPWMNTQSGPCSRAVSCSFAAAKARASSQATFLNAWSRLSRIAGVTMRCGFAAWKEDKSPLWQREPLLTGCSSSP